MTFYGELHSCMNTTAPFSIITHLRAHGRAIIGNIDNVYRGVKWGNQQQVNTALGVNAYGEPRTLIIALILDTQPEPPKTLITVHILCVHNLFVNTKGRHNVIKTTYDNMATSISAQLQCDYWEMRRI